MANLFSNSMILPLLVVATRSAGANTNQALPLILVASMSGSPMMAVVIAAALVRAQKPIPPVTIVPTTGAAGPPRTITMVPAGSPGSPGPNLVHAFGGMLSFLGLHKKDARNFATLLGLQYVEIESKGEVVVKQHPRIREPFTDKSIKLWFGEPPVEPAS